MEQKKTVGYYLNKFQKPLIILVIVIGLTAVLGRMFLSLNNFYSIMLSICIYGLMMCGTIYVILVGGIDLSIGSICALAGSIMIMTTIRSGYTVGGTILGIILGILAAMACGLANGLITYLFDIPAFVVTLAMKNVVLGITQVVTGQETIGCYHSKIVDFLGTGRVFGIPFPVLFFVIVFLISFFALNYTKFGRRMYAVGGNPTASTFSGINAKLHGIAALTISGFTAGLTGIMLSCFNRQCVHTQGASYDGNVLIALVVGGVSLAGGEGTLQGGFFGLLLLGILSNAMVLLGISSMYQDLLQGVLALLAVAIDMAARSNDGVTRRKKVKVKAAKAE